MPFLKTLATSWLLYAAVYAQQNDTSQKERSCDNYVWVRSQADLDAILPRCKNLPEMRLRPSFGGPLNLDGFKSVGSIYPDTCTEPDPIPDAESAVGSCNITSISSTTLTYVGGVTVRNQPLLTYISLPEVARFGRRTFPDNLVLDNLPALETVNLSRLEIARNLEIKNTPKLSTLQLAPAGWPAHPGISEGEDPPSIYYARITVSNTSLADIDSLFKSTSHVKEINTFKNPNVKSLTIHSPAGEATVSGNGELDFTYNLTGSKEPWVGSLFVGGLSKFKTEGVKNVSSFSAALNSFERLDVDFPTAALRIENNQNLASLYLHEAINGSVYIRDNMLNLTFPTGEGATLDQDVGYWKWPNASSEIDAFSVSGWVSNRVFAGLTEADISTVPRIKELTVNTQNPDFNCTLLERLQTEGKIGKLTCEDDFATPFYGSKDEGSGGREARPSFAALAIVLGCATYISL